MIKSYKVRLEPTEKQAELMFKTSGCARFIYNWCVAFQKERYENNEKFIPDKGMSKYLTQLKRDGNHDWLKEVDSIALVSAYTDACNAFKNFFREIKKGNKNQGYPRFKSKKHTKPSFMPNYQAIKISENQVKLPKIGLVKLSRKNYIPIADKYSNPRITFDGLYWYISVGVEEEELQTELSGIIGVDLGLKDTAILSDGTVYKNINKTKLVKRIEKRLKKLQRQVSRKYEMNKEGKNFIKTNNIIKLEKEILKLHKRLANIRNNYNHTITHQIVEKNPQKVVIEDLNVKGMMKNKHQSKSIGKQGWYEIRRQLEYKCKEKGIELIVADRWYPSSKTCSNCGNVKKDLKLKDRVYICPVCGLTIDRDLNASINLATNYLDYLANNYKTEI